jgi:hypothetical protein
MRNAVAIAEVQPALGVARIGSGATLSGQRRAAELRIDLRRARVLTLVSRRLRASRSLLAVDGQAATRPSTAARASVSPRRSPESGGQLATARHRAWQDLNRSATGSGGEMSVNGVLETDRPTINERLGLRLARPADGGRRSTQPNTEIATDAEAVPAAAGGHGQGASVAGARKVAERGHGGPLDAQRGATR